MKPDEQWLKNRLMERFDRYVRIDTTSDLHNDREIPSTPGQWDLLRLLEQEVKDLGIPVVLFNEDGYLIARVPSNQDGAAPVIGFMAHVDTSPDVTGKDVRPQVHDAYAGQDLKLKDGLILSPSEYPELLKHTGDTLITSDGTTLLGADDKAGVAEIITAMEWILLNPEVPHGDIEIIFTPDEETGRGLTNFPLKTLKSVYCYTLDGGEEGLCEVECFNAFRVRVSCRGRVIHLGQARGKLVNAVTMLSSFLSMLPGAESPEATDGRYGYYCPLECRGNLEQAEADIYLRDFDLKEIHRRIDVLTALGTTVEKLFPGGTVEVTSEEQYLNMLEHINKNPRGLELLEKAVRLSGIEPVREIIRGGTDGSKLSQMGIPTPNIFTGGHNFHSRLEWASLRGMVRAAETVIHLCALWTEK
ncbi:MAG: peptidase T [Spirochaetales bacterium]|nr:peptidase T [Spirochaetales bacterium]